MTISSGDRFLPVRTSDGIIHAMGKLKAPTITGDRFIIVRAADGTPMAVKCVAVDASGQRGIPVMLADGVPSLVRFDFDDECFICQLSPWHGGSMLYERDYSSYGYEAGCDFGGGAEKETYTSQENGTLPLTHLEAGGIRAQGTITVNVDGEYGPTEEICDIDSYPVLYPGPPYLGPPYLDPGTRTTSFDAIVGLAPKRDCDVETWDASTNTPTLEDGEIVSPRIRCVVKGGTQDLGSGDIEFATGDYVVQLFYPSTGGYTLPPEHGNWVKVDPGQAIAGPEWTVLRTYEEFVDGFGLLDGVGTYTYVGYGQFNDGLISSVEEIDYTFKTPIGSLPDQDDVDVINRGYQTTKTFTSTAGGTVNETHEETLSWRADAAADIIGGVAYYYAYYGGFTTFNEDTRRRTFTQGT